MQCLLIYSHLVCVCYGFFLPYRRVQSNMFSLHNEWKKMPQNGPFLFDSPLCCRFNSNNFHTPLVFLEYFARQSIEFHLVHFIRCTSRQVKFNFYGKNTCNERQRSIYWLMDFWLILFFSLSDVCVCVFLSVFSFWWVNVMRIFDHLWNFIKLTIFSFDTPEQQRN